jgi:hypothetical protein
MGRISAYLCHCGIAGFGSVACVWFDLLLVPLQPWVDSIATAFDVAIAQVFSFIGELFIVSALFVH